MTVTERADRARRIAQRKATGLTWEQLAQEFNVSVSTARRAAEAHVAGTHRLAEPPAVPDVSVPPRPADLDPQEIFVEVVAAHRDAMTDLAALAREADNDSARVGAIKARTAAGAQLVALLASVGLMPDPARVLLARAQAIQARAVARERGEVLLGGGL
jgi:orotate phosphoribosyltransferase-like protein